MAMSGIRCVAMTMISYEAEEEGVRLFKSPVYSNFGVLIIFGSVHVIYQHGQI